MLTRTGLVLTGQVMSVDPAANFSGIGKTSGKAYSMNRRRFQLFANKVLYDCQDSRDDLKDGDRVLALGIDRFVPLESGQMVSFPVVRIEVGKALSLSYDLDTN